MEKDERADYSFAAEKTDLPLLLQLIPQLHDPDLNPPLPLMIQDPGVRLTMYRWTLEIVDEVSIVTCSAVCAAGWTVPDLEDGGVTGDVAVRPARGWSAVVEAREGEELTCHGLLQGLYRYTSFKPAMKEHRQKNCETYSSYSGGAPENGGDTC